MSENYRCLLPHQILYLIDNHKYAYVILSWMYLRIHSGENGTSLEKKEIYISYIDLKDSGYRNNRKPILSSYQFQVGMRSLLDLGFIEILGKGYAGKKLVKILINPFSCEGLHA